MIHSLFLNAFYFNITNMKKNRFICTVLFSLSFALFSQEALKSIEEEYYDFLSLQGITERPYLNYRTLSDSEWNIKEDENTSHPWKDLNLGTKKTLKKNFSIKQTGF